MTNEPQTLQTALHSEGLETFRNGDTVEAFRDWSYKSGADTTTDWYNPADDYIECYSDTIKITFTDTAFIAVDEFGEAKENTEWVRIVAFRKLAEIIAEYLQKGSQVFISGKMKTRKWQDQNGQDRYTTEIIADQMQMLGSKQDSNRPPPHGDKQPLGDNKGSQNYARAKNGNTPPQNDFIEDSIPF